MNIASLNTLLQPWLTFLADDPALRALQGGMLLAGALVVFLVFYATRDILLRTHSFLFMFICIVLVAFLPIIGFFFYLLIRPARTIKEREVESMLKELLAERTIPKTSQPSSKKGRIVKKPKKKAKKPPTEDLSL